MSLEFDVLCPLAALKVACSYLFQYWISKFTNTKKARTLEKESQAHT